MTVKWFDFDDDVNGKKGLGHDEISIFIR